MGDEAHDCEELPGIECVLGAQSGIKELEDLRAEKVKKTFGMRRENVRHLHPIEALRRICL
jgi:hypothetical protein